MNSIDKRTSGVFGNISLTLKIAAIMLVMALVLGAVINHLHGRMLREQFNAQLTERLDGQSSENRQIFDNYFLGYQRAAGALANTCSMAAYVKNVAWESGQTIKTYEEQDIPPWLPRASVLKYYVGIEYAVLYDAEGRLREVYNETATPLPGVFSNLEQLRLPQEQSRMTALDGINYILASENVKDSTGNKAAVLVIAHRINNDLLQHTMGALSDRRTVVLADAKDHTIIAINRPELLTTERKLEDLNNNFIFGGKSFLDYGENELYLMFASLIPLSDVSVLREKVQSGSKRFSIISAATLLLAFIVIMLYITTRIKMLDNYVSTVSKEHLGIEPPGSLAGDQLMVLEQRFHGLFDEIIVAKAQLEARAEELERINNELKEATAQLIQSAKLSALGELTAGIAHELNQPLNGIKIVCQSILKDIQKDRHDPQELVTDLSDIVKQVDKMAAIIDHMRVFTRRTEAMNTEILDINTVVEEPFKLLDQQLKNIGIIITKNLAQELPQVKGDVIRLEQVFINLITNARNAMRDDQKGEKHLTISTYPLPPDKVVIEIGDTGAGVPDAIKDKIFQPFFTTNAPGKGTGLGLSVSKKIIEEHGGIISVESTVGKGTIFRIMLPTMEGERYVTA
ncbi:sensor histidine kinase [Candidatus Magnetominusculus dajiuhuensis]|uniref:sensor histidine kinase n=1 Tax=Candidatus Magnetominusculus dajiuhuensis TaxID=3137712 RepID=UPI003B428B96